MALPTTDTSVAKIARTFWEGAGEMGEWPRDLSTAIILSSYPLSIEEIPRLNTKVVEEWFAQQETVFKFPCERTDLHGCLAVRRGRGFIFVDESDTAKEKRFTLAHELSHFILDYHLPRQQALQRFGEKILEVFDGDRPPTIAEQVEGILHSVEIQPDYRLLQSGGEGIYASSKSWNAEERADRLAYELIAPADSVYPQVEEDSFYAALESIRNVLAEKYKLPPLVIEPYAHNLAARLTGGPSSLSYMGLE